MPPRASVVVPAFNAERSIGQCLSALAAQTCPAGSYEVIVVDDGSTDATGEIARKFPIKYIRQDNAGPATARNRGAKEAAGEIILFTDSDCVPEPGWIEQMTRPFADPAVVAVKGAYGAGQEGLTARFAQVEFEERFEMLKKAESIDMVDTYSAAFRSSDFRETGGFDQSFPHANNEDTDLSYKLSAAGKKMVFNPDAKVKHLGHPGSPWKYARLKFWRGYWRMVVYKRHPGKMVKDTYTPQTLKLQIALIFAAAGLGALCPVSHPAGWASLVLLIAFAASTVPFTIFAFRRDAAVGALAPAFLALRAAAIGCGILYYMAGAKAGRD
ncbi:MAG: glycosyltransferase [Nitrospinae bacterium]|nr:glycosyltransferase [Nitrospinota bacterium]